MPNRLVIRKGAAALPPTPAVLPTDSRFNLTYDVMAFLMYGIQAGAKPTVTFETDDGCSWISLCWWTPGNPKKIRVMASLEHGGWALYLFEYTQELTWNDVPGRSEPYANWWNTNHCLKRWRFSGHFAAERKPPLPYDEIGIDTGADRRHFIDLVVIQLNQALRATGLAPAA